MKVGYWIVVSLVVVALVAVVVAVWSDPSSGTEMRPATWVALGASDGTGEGLDRPETEAWPAVVAASLPPPAPRVVNASVGGLTVDRALAETLPEVLALRPEVVIVWLVVNDFGNGRPLAAYLADLDDLLGRIRGTGAKVVVGNLPDLSTLPFLAEASGDPAGLREDCRRWNEAIAQVAATHGARIVDFFGDPIAPETVGADGFHPSAEGQRRLAERFRTAALAA